MASLADILAARRNPQTDPRPWDTPMGGAQPMPAATPGPAATPMPAGMADPAMALAGQLEQRQRAFAQGAAPGAAVLQAAPLGSLKTNAAGNVEVPAGLFAQIMQKLGLGGGGQTPPAGGQ